MDNSRQASFLNSLSLNINNPVELSEIILEEFIQRDGSLR